MAHAHNRLWSTRHNGSQPYSTLFAPTSKVNASCKYIMLWLHWWVIATLHEEPIHTSIRTQVAHGVRAQAALQPEVECGVLRVRRQVALEEQAHGVALQAQRRLHAHPHLAQLQAAHHTAPCAHMARLQIIRGFPRRC